MKQIKIGDINYSLKLGTKFLENVTKGEGITVSDVFSKYENETLLFVPKLIYYSINTSLYAESKELIKDDLVFDWFDAVGISSDEVKSFNQYFADAIMVHLPKEDLVGKPKVQAKKN